MWRFARGFRSINIPWWQAELELGSASLAYFKVRHLKYSTRTLYPFPARVYTVPLHLD